jgi:hypothetical protein
MQLFQPKQFGTAEIGFISSVAMTSALKRRSELGGRQEKALSAAPGADIQGVSPHITCNRQGAMMVRHTVLGFKLEHTEESMTAHGGLALLAECTHGLGLCAPSSISACPSLDVIVALPPRCFGFKRLACTAGWASQTIATVRWKLVQVAGRILRHARQVALQLVLEAEALTCLRAIRQRCWVLGVVP